MQCAIEGCMCVWVFYWLQVSLQDTCNQFLIDHMHVNSNVSIFWYVLELWKAVYIFCVLCDIVNSDKMILMWLILSACRELTAENSTAESNG